MKRIRDRGPLLLVAAALLWSFSGLFVKSVSWDSLSISAVRGMVAFVLISAVRRPFPIRLNRIKVLTSACYVAQGVLFIAAHSRTTAASATALQYTSPLYIIFFAFLAERKLPKFRDVISCLALLSGIVLSCLGGLRGGGLTGNLLAMASAVFYAGVFYGSRLPGGDGVDSVVLGAAFYFLLLPWVLSSDAVRTAPLTDLLLVLLFGISSSVAWIAFGVGIRTTPSLKANFIAMLEPVTAPIWTFFLLHEVADPLSLAGFAVVIIALLCYHWAEHQAAISQKE